MGLGATAKGAPRRYSAVLCINGFRALTPLGSGHTRTLLKTGQAIHQNAAATAKWDAFTEVGI